MNELNSLVYQKILAKKASGKRMVALLIDPDKFNESSLINICSKAEKRGLDFIFIGGSLLTDGEINETVRLVKRSTSIPTVLFPGSPSQISDAADAILFLSLLSSRNAEMLIGQQVVAAPYLRKTFLEVISTAYLIIESGTQTTASYMSNSNPIPATKAEIAASTALAGEYLGMNLVYMDGGSGAKNCVPPKMIEKVRNYVSKPIIVGGGINTVEKAESAFKAGADMIVVGNAIETNPNFIDDLSQLTQ